MAISKYVISLLFNSDSWVRPSSSLNPNIKAEIVFVKTVILEFVARIKALSVLGERLECSQPRHPSPAKLRRPEAEQLPASDCLPASPKQSSSPARSRLFQ